MLPLVLPFGKLSQNLAGFECYWQLIPSLDSISSTRCSSLCSPQEAHWDKAERILKAARDHKLLYSLILLVSQTRKGVGKNDNLIMNLVMIQKDKLTVIYMCWFRIHRFHLLKIWKFPLVVLSWNSCTSWSLCFSFNFFSKPHTCFPGQALALCQQGFQLIVIHVSLSQNFCRQLALCCWEIREYYVII